jgi:CRP-like cAMP-binding protein
MGREFGEIAVIRGEPRQSTITSLNDADLLIIKKDMYLKYCGKQRIQFIREVQTFYEENYLMRGVSYDSKENLAKKSFPKKYLANQTLVHQGSKADTLFFISKGGVRLLRNIKKRHLKNFEINYEYKKEMLSLPDIIKLDVQTLCTSSQSNKRQGQPVRRVRAAERAADVQ